MSSKNQILKLYKSLLRESQKFQSYNYRTYSLRRVRDGFKENKKLADEAVIAALVKEANRNLEIIKRQVVLSEMYSTEKLVIEKLKHVK